MSLQYDLLIRNATVIDGTRAPRFEADIGILDGKIARVGRLEKDGAESEIDAAGRVAAPGFIDAHTHDDRLMLSALLDDGSFVALPPVPEALLEKRFRHAVLALLADAGAISQALRSKLLGWLHSGFSVHNQLIPIPNRAVKRRRADDIADCP